MVLAPAMVVLVPLASSPAPHPPVFPANYPVRCPSRYPGGCGKVLVDVANAVEQGPDGFASRLLYHNLADELQRMHASRYSRGQGAELGGAGGVDG